MKQSSILYQRKGGPIQIYKRTTKVDHFKVKAPLSQPSSLRFVPLVKQSSFFIKSHSSSLSSGEARFHSLSKTKLITYIISSCEARLLLIKALHLHSFLWLSKVPSLSNICVHILKQFIKNIKDLSLIILSQLKN